MANSAMIGRMKKELEMLDKDPPHGICAWPKDDSINCLEATLQGPEDTPYEKGVFRLEIIVPDRYPFEPPVVRFLTSIYHPNIDNGGRICLDTLRMPPKGAWKPSLNISTVLTTLHLLLSEPNPEDGLMLDISNEFRNDPPKFVETARNWTRKYATPQNDIVSNTSLKVEENVEEEEIKVNKKHKKDAEEEIQGNKKPKLESNDIKRKEEDKKNLKRKEDTKEVSKKKIN